MIDKAFLSAEAAYLEPIWEDEQKPDYDDLYADFGEMRDEI